VVDTMRYHCFGCDDTCVLSTEGASDRPEYCPKSGNQCDDWEVEK